MHLIPPRYQSSSEYELFLPLQNPFLMPGASDSNMEPKGIPTIGSPKLGHCIHPTIKGLNLFFNPSTLFFLHLKKKLFIQKIQEKLYIRFL
ncbi:hypothetical protein EM20IM_04735 [Candidatus Methylacidiphilum infernorum]|uniref:Uncharacterized protein n=1 Tax=Candidatus Methylacidiphilum infernorum TaxID=511746 RepID=A0ABX7PY54_9BACT|nr:hypothetical protein [Candidatus Methylacidiphilum infernorum]QSR87629.1 hypothetical protein EM20IM_04735 [Candidatus Methylacidiphilum infernorum]